MSSSIRALWIIVNDEVVVSRHFPSVEFRAQYLGLSPIPSSRRVKEVVLGMEMPNAGYVILSDPIDLVLLESKKGTIIVAALLSQSSIVSTLSILETIGAALPASGFGHVHSLCAAGLPLGTPIHSHEDTLKALVKRSKETIREVPSVQPVWRPFLNGGERPSFIIWQREIVRSVAFGRKEIPDEWEAHGVLTCDIDIENVPDITLGVRWDKQAEYMTVHNCANPPDSFIPDCICFRPPSHPFILCRYKLKRKAVRVPIRSFFQLKMASKETMKFLFQVKLVDNSYNRFDYLTARMPFGTKRGKVQGVDATPSCGSVRIDDDTQCLVWDIGSRIPQKNCEVALSGTISFHPDSPVQGVLEGGAREEDPFLVENNAYVDLSFKMPGIRLSSVEVDVENVVCHPEMRLQPHVRKEVINAEYRVWNSLGESHMVAPVP